MDLTKVNRLQSIINKQKYKNLIAIVQKHNVSKNTSIDETKQERTDHCKGVVNILSTTHGARLKCLVDQICGTYDKNVWFKNCCILKLSLSTHDDSCHLSMIHQGSVIHREDAIYYRTPDLHLPADQRSNDVIFEPVICPIHRLNLIPGSIKHNYDIYMIRHGESLHNLPTSQHNVTDTSLTFAGIQQANDAGKIIDFLGLKKIDYMFCSNLKRTRETLIHCIESIHSTHVPDRIVVLPCSHEITYVNEPNCDEKQNQSNGSYYFENVSKCSNKHQRNKQCTDDSILGPDALSKINLSIDWTYEDRSNMCNDQNNMIFNMINIIDDINH
jgi:broad specificity phosphatase PhoE